MSTVCFDHLGNQYASITKMCDAYRISKTLYYKRLESGKNIKEILTGEFEDNRKKRKSVPVTDHLGNIYDSLQSMCDAYGVSTALYYQRQKKGRSIEDSLKRPNIYKCLTVTDHLGNEFLSQQEMCDAYHVKPPTFKKRLSRGWTIKEALTGTHERNHPKATSCVDHLGNQFPSLNAMCTYHNVLYNHYKYRIEHGCSVKEALCPEPLKHKLTHARMCTDHLGNKYDSLSLMCEAYSTDYLLFLNRIHIGWSVERALLTPKKNYRRKSA